VNKILLLKDLLRKVQNGALFNLVCGWLVRITGFALVVPILSISMDMWSIANMGKPPIEVYLYLVLAQIVWLGIWYVLINLFWVRGTDILTLKQDAEYSTTPIFVTLFKTFSEMAAFGLVGMTTLMALATWIAPVLTRFASKIAPFMPPMLFRLSSNDFLQGLAVLVSGPVFAFIILTIGYFLAETIGALVSIARHTEKTPRKQ